ncbi:FHA domain-containing protein FhaB/FipA [Corynebacterium tapiri]|uniref:FHA domain-containing protein n=1 Tax=Corynebacterium tapiri TaxID=1448266 RepID=A0A5C4U2Q0_9CORY|nr:FHA domain-containing protein [Corynebacterium tapiri]TNL96835.1 FHA domain-containing protein [Corynebacterium tapiri]
MEAALLTIVRIALLVLLWAFILLAVLAMRKDANRAAGVGRNRGSGGYAAAAAPVAAAPVAKREKARLLTVVDGPLTGSHMDVSQLEEVIVGRSQACDFELGDDYASSRHARFFRRGGDWFIEDLESRNGTYVGGYRIDQPERVQVGTDVKMGSTIVRLAP